MIKITEANEVFLCTSQVCVMTKTDEIGTFFGKERILYGKLDITKKFK